MISLTTIKILWFEHFLVILIVLLDAEHPFWVSSIVGLSPKARLYFMSIWLKYWFLFGLKFILEEIYLWWFFDKSDVSIESKMWMKYSIAGLCLKGLEWVLGTRLEFGVYYHWFLILAPIVNEIFSITYS